MLVRFIIIALLVIIAIMYYRGVKRANSRDKITDQNEAERRFDPYKVLQVPRDATREEIHKAWVSLAAQYHPDKAAHLGPDLQKLAERRFKEIQRAYDILKQDQ